MSANNWYACELHCHTVHSDGKFTVNSLLSTARERGLNGICLTDHNTISGWIEAKNSESPVVLCGIEWTTYYGHMLVLDCEKYVDWRNALPDNIDEKMTEVHKYGGLVGIAHPFELGTPICTGGYWNYNVQDRSLINYIEIWSEGEPHLNTCNRRGIEMWQKLLDKGYRIAATFGRDWHNAEHDIYPSACTYLGSDGDLSPESMKKAIREGRTVVSAGPMFCFETENGKTVGDSETAGEHTVTFTTNFSRMIQYKFKNVMTPKKLRLVTNGGGIAFETDYSEKISVTAELSANHWYSAELWGEIDGQKDCMLAKTSPIYIGY